MKITSLEVFAELERLAEACPWDQVQLTIRREPAGSLEFVAYAPDNEKYGFGYACGSGPSPAEAVSSLLKDCGGRDPALTRDKKVEELKRQIEQLQAVIVGMPPYRPNRELASGTATVPDPIFEV